jgi:hypothetical protein
MAATLSLSFTMMDAKAHHIGVLSELLALLFLGLIILQCI